MAKKINISIEEVNDKIKDNCENFIEKSEKYYYRQLKNVVDTVKANKHIKFILLSGPSSAGKTTTGGLLVNMLTQANRRCKVVSLDDFFLERDETPFLPNGEKDYDSVNSIDWKLFEEKVIELFKNKKAILPVFDFKEGIKKYPTEYTTLGENEILIFEGLHALNPLLDKFFPKNSQIKIFLNNETSYTSQGATIISNYELRLVRRLIRDEYKRGYPPEDTMQHWKNVRHAEEEYIFPFKKDANFIINTSFFYEAGIYSFILKHMKFNDEYLNNIKKCFFNILPISPLKIPDNSLLFEFIVKGHDYTESPKINKKG